MCLVLQLLSLWLLLIANIDATPTLEVLVAFSCVWSVWTTPCLHRFDVLNLCYILLKLVLCLDQTCRLTVTFPATYQGQRSPQGSYTWSWSAYTSFGWKTFGLETFVWCRACWRLVDSSEREDPEAISVPDYYSLLFEECQLWSFTLNCDWYCPGNKAHLLARWLQPSACLNGH